MSKQESTFKHPQLCFPAKLRSRRKFIASLTSKTFPPMYMAELRFLCGSEIEFL